MNRIISQPFELELHTWFEEFASRIARSPFAQEDWVQNGLNSLARLKEQVAINFRLGSTEVESTHKSLTCSAAQLLEEVVAEEGPTAASWLNRPILKLQSYLAGGPLDQTHVFATWAFLVGIESGDIPLGASVSLFMVPILAIAAVFILRDITKRGSEV